MRLSPRQLHIGFWGRVLTFCGAFRWRALSCRKLESVRIDGSWFMPGVTHTCMIEACFYVAICKVMHDKGKVMGQQQVGFQHS